MSPVLVLSCATVAGCLSPTVAFNFWVSHLRPETLKMVFVTPTSHRPPFMSGVHGKDSWTRCQESEQLLLTVCCWHCTNLPSRLMPHVLPHCEHQLRNPTERQQTRTHHCSLSSAMNKDHLSHAGFAFRFYSVALWRTLLQSSSIALKHHNVIWVLGDCVWKAAVK